MKLTLRNILIAFAAFIAFGLLFGTFSRVCDKVEEIERSREFWETLEDTADRENLGIEFADIQQAFPDVKFEAKFVQGVGTMWAGSLEFGGQPISVYAVTVLVYPSTTTVVACGITIIAEFKDLADETIRTLITTCAPSWTDGPDWVNDNILQSIDNEVIATFPEHGIEVKLAQEHSDYGLITGEIWSWGDDDGSSAEEIPAVPTLVSAPARTIVSSQNFATVSAGVDHTCGVRTDGAVECWGRDVYGEATPPAGEFASVSAGAYYTCVVRRDSSVKCWGFNRFEKASSPSGEVASVSAGDNHTCVVRRDGSVECWGWDNYGQATPPAGEFASVSVGYRHTCGVRTGGSVECWGSNEGDGFTEVGQAIPPTGEFASVSAGRFHTCGMRRNGSVECWGFNRNGRATPPAGEFASVNAGYEHTCGVRSGGSVECWGDNDYGKAEPPDGSFALVSAGEAHTCGVRTDGLVECWGYDEDGKTTPP